MDKPSAGDLATVLHEEYAMANEARILHRAQLAAAYRYIAQLEAAVTSLAAAPAPPEEGEPPAAEPAPVPTPIGPRTPRGQRKTQPVAV